MFLAITINGGPPVWQSWAGIGLVFVDISIFRFVLVSDEFAGWLANVSQMFGGWSALRGLGRIAWLVTLLGMMLPLSLSVYGGSMAFKGFLNRIIVDDTHIEFRKGLQPRKIQLWSELDVVVAAHPEILLMRFKESGRYEVILEMPKKDLGYAETAQLVDWLEQRFPGKVYRK